MDKGCKNVEVLQSADTPYKFKYNKPESWDLKHCNCGNVLFAILVLV